MGGVEYFDQVLTVLIKMQLYQVMSTALVMIVLWLVVRVYRAAVMEPNRLRSSLQKQGITGPPPAFLLGNLLQFNKVVDEAKAAKPTTSTITHNCLPIIFPFLNRWTQEYGQVFMFSMGVQTMLHVIRPDLVKEMRTNMSWDLGKPSFFAQEFRPIFGRGILSSNGSHWAHQRKIISPHLYLDKVKGMMELIADSSVVLINSWMKEIKNKGNDEGAIDMKIDGSLKIFGGYIMAKACFGKNFSQIEILDSKFERLGHVLTSDTPGILTSFPVLRYFPSKKTKESWVLEDEIHSLIVTLVKERKEVGYEAKDFLQVLIESAEDQSHGMNQDAMNEFIVDNIKNIYVAGVETISVSALWCLMLLASNPDWQTRVRAEVLQVCKGKIPDSSMLPQMKQLTMVIYESLRLYSPAAVMVRETQEDMKIGDIFVAKGVNVWSHVYTLHTDPQNWGSDSFEFNPQRFANGIMGACKFPHLYMPFGYGPRTCTGQHLAMVELKVIISLIVANFSFSISPKYVHSPIFTQFVKPKYGVNLVVKKV